MGDHAVSVKARLVSRIRSNRCQPGIYNRRLNRAGLSVEKFLSRLAPEPKAALAVGLTQGV
jgi:hypothetical protein